MPWTVYNSDGQILQGSSTLADDAVTTAKILDANVTLAKVASQAANTVLVRDANSSGVVSAKAVTDTQVLIGDGTGFTAAALSGEATMSNAGAVLIADNIIDEANLKSDNSPTNDHVLTAKSSASGGLTWAAAGGGGAVTREGGQLTEGATGSSSSAGTLQTAAVSIAANEYFTAVHVCRKSASYAEDASVGYTLNSTVMVTPVADSDTNHGWMTTGTQRAESGATFYDFAPRKSNYRTGIDYHSISKIDSTAGNNGEGSSQHLNGLLEGNLLPTVEITSFVLTGLVGHANLTVYTDELHLYSWASS